MGKLESSDWSKTPWNSNFFQMPSCMHLLQGTALCCTPHTYTFIQRGREVSYLIAFKHCVMLLKILKIINTKRCITQTCLRLQ